VVVALWRRGRDLGDVSVLLGEALDREDVPLRGEQWRAAIDTPHSLILHRWADAGERDQPTGPRVRVTFTVHVEEVAA
jgi:hypothetical protein